MLSSFSEGNFFRNAKRMQDLWVWSWRMKEFESLMVSGCLDGWVPPVNHTPVIEIKPQSHPPSPGTHAFPCPYKDDNPPEGTRGRKTHTLDCLLCSITEASDCCPTWNSIQKKGNVYVFGDTGGAIHNNLSNCSTQYKLCYNKRIWEYWVKPLFHPLPWSWHVGEGVYVMMAAEPV